MDKFILRVVAGASIKIYAFQGARQTLDPQRIGHLLYTLSGLLSDDCTINPYFCGWSMVFVGYCDGSSFAGNV